MKTKHFFIFLVFAAVSIPSCNTGKHYARLRINHSYQTQEVGENPSSEVEKTAAYVKEKTVPQEQYTAEPNQAVLQAKNQAPENENQKVQANRFAEPLQHKTEKSLYSLKRNLLPAQHQLTDEKSGGSVLGTVLVAILLFLLALVFLLFIPVIGLLFFIIFTLSAIIVLIVALVSLL